MVKIDKTDIENIQLISKETKLQNITSVRIKKGNYEIEVSSLSKSTKQEFIQLQENKTKHFSRKSFDRNAFLAKQLCAPNFLPNTITTSILFLRLIVFREKKV